MQKAIYHAPLGDRGLFFKSKNEDGTIDLLNEQGELEIGSCKINGGEGGCSIQGVEIGNDDRESNYASYTKAELVAHAESLGLETAGLNKDAIITLIAAHEDQEP